MHRLLFVCFCLIRIVSCDSYDCAFPMYDAMLFWLNKSIYLSIYSCIAWFNIFWPVNTQTTFSTFAVRRFSDEPHWLLYIAHCHLDRESCDSYPGYLVSRCSTSGALYTPSPPCAHLLSTVFASATSSVFCVPFSPAPLYHHCTCVQNNRMYLIVRRRQIKGDTRLPKLLYFPRQVVNLHVVSVRPSAHRTH